MNLITVLILALGLCLDSFAVSLTHGMSQYGNRKMHFYRFSFILAFFQGTMPLLGWGLTSGFHDHIQRFDHWVAFGLLTLLGLKMIRESRKKEHGTRPGVSRFNLKNTVLLGLATSIDALITGAAMALAVIEIIPKASPLGNMLMASGIIFSVTFIACIAGVHLGRTAGGRLGKHAELAGGILLIGIGVKVLLDHLCGM